MKKSNRKKKKMPSIKKDIKKFLLSEEGKIDKKIIAKLGLSLAALGMLFDSEHAYADHTNHNSHANDFFFTGLTSRGGHTSNMILTDVHANHGNHGDGGPCGW